MQGELNTGFLENENDAANWHYPPGNEVEYSSLNPGDYVFQLRPDWKTDDNTNITSIHLSIKCLCGGRR